ncbi:uncharacterized protein [Venturia canescens]|uniref:uncharacterized protein isoform X2 n=1 Tax=Venturia canescens TaxID=32260 RepID=UPI001C9C70F0|nr:uncharacterized protein LOC122413654 isoform X2 [Venturia canescens]
MRIRGRRKATSEHGGRYLRVGRLVCNLCDHHLMGSSVYVITIGLIGTFITAYDIIRMMKYKIPVRRTACAARTRAGEAVPRDVERDLKLMTSILGIEHYTLITIGAITEFPMLHTPWLLMQLCVIIVEVVLFVMRLFLVGLHMKRNEILSAMIAVFNWLQVFCLFHRQSRSPVQ